MPNSTPQPDFQSAHIDSWRTCERAPGYRPAGATIILEHGQYSEAFAITENFSAFYDWYSSDFDDPEPGQTTRDYFLENGVKIHLYL